MSNNTHNSIRLLALFVPDYQVSFMAMFLFRLLFRSRIIFGVMILGVTAYSGRSAPRPARASPIGRPP